ncbi:MAG: multicopper oxidase domain-containing protein [Pyrinomonadaceae bacterium]|nr:multicopper oxidase domain-containing protein [Pyrinomonadaceae bacterium]
MKRRDFVKLTGVAGAALLGDRRAFSARPERTASVPDVIINLRAVVSTISLLPGAPTQVWRYEGEVVEGTPQNLQPIPGSFLGPTIRVHRGQTIRINFTNNLPEMTLMHWHGLHVPEAMDAHPRFTVEPGASYVYEFTVMNRAGTYWYHPHPDMRTAFQVYCGLAGLFIVSDDEEQGLGLPSGEADVPIVLQDRIFAPDNQFVYSSIGMVGFLGDRMLVNGNLARSVDVASRAYRLRFLNGSNSRFYKLAWSDGTPLTVIASDGGLLEAPVERPYLMLAPGERYEVIADFRNSPLRRNRRLVSQAFSPMGNAGNGGAALPNGAAFPIVSFRVRRRVADNFVLPPTLSTITRYRLEDAVNAANPRAFPISFQMGMFMLNGGMFEMNGVAPNESVALNTLEAWDIANQSGPVQMAHPMHIHLVQFQIIERQMNASGATNYEGVKYGFVDTGWKDTFMLMPGERVRLLLRFEDFTGKFVYHCHNLEHEDMGMMRNFQVNPAARWIK